MIMMMSSEILYFFCVMHAHYSLKLFSQHTVHHHRRKKAGTFFYLARDTQSSTRRAGFFLLLRLLQKQTRNVHKEQYIFLLLWAVPLFLRSLINVYRKENRISQHHFLSIPFVYWIILYRIIVIFYLKKKQE